MRSGGPRRPAFAAKRTLATMAPMVTNSAEPDGQNVELLGRLVSHRLQQDDIKHIVEQLSRRERAQFVSTLNDLLKKTSALLEVSRASESLSLDVLMPKMVEIISDFLGAERCTLFL